MRSWKSWKTTRFETSRFSRGELETLVLGYVRTKTFVLSYLALLEWTWSSVCKSYFFEVNSVFHPVSTGVGHAVRSKCLVKWKVVHLTCNSAHLPHTVNKSVVVTVYWNNIHVNCVISVSLQTNRGQTQRGKHSPVKRAFLFFEIMALGYGVKISKKKIIKSRLKFLIAQIYWVEINH